LEQSSEDTETVAEEHNMPWHQEVERCFA
jgi:hypothetical protein